MNAFLQDLWHDLREKRLWPVAVALLVGVVAIPALLLKGSEPAGAPTPAPGTPASGGNAAAVVALADDAAAGSSDLESFDPKDPFDAPGNPGGESEAPAGETPSGGGSEQGGDAPASGGDPGSSGGGSAPAPPGGDTGGRDTGDDAPRRVSYTYVVDVRFGRRDAGTRLYRNLARLDVLPRTETPLLIFLGVSPTRKSATFLVDSSAEQRGDGRCQPSRDECTFLHLTTQRGHDLHYLTTPEGESYAIRLLDIRRVRTDELREQRAREARRARRARKSGSRRRAASPRRFGSALFGPDEVVEG